MTAKTPFVIFFFLHQLLVVLNCEGVVNLVIFVLQSFDVEAQHFVSSIEWCC